MELELVLTEAKAAADGRLSVSRETKGEVIGARRLFRPEVQAMIFQDYRRLLDWLILSEFWEWFYSFNWFLKF